jgi:hypothetical protein
MSYTQIDNILGQPIPDYAINQLKIRSKNTLGVRDNNALVYTANKSAWVRVVSSVDITGSVSFDGIKVVAGDELAKDNVLFGGISAYSNQGKVNYQIKPYYSDDVQKQRRDQFDSEYGFRPMPGIVSAKISTQGKLGSILIAEIDFKANTKQQLDMIDILYFKVGYSMLVEWGNTFYYKQAKTDVNNQLISDPQLYKSEDSSIDPFVGFKDKETIRINITRAIRETEGNYCAMLGIVTNYSFTMNSDGGYDCKIKVMGPGMLAESMRVNGITTLPLMDIFKQALTNLANVLTSINRTRAEIEREKEQQEEAKQLSENKDAYPPCVRKLIESGELPIGTSSQGRTGAGANLTSGPWKGYIFYYDATNPSTPTKGKYYSTAIGGDGNYSCDQYGNILDSDKGTILGRTIQVPPLTVQEEYALVKRDSANYQNITTNRYASTRYQNYPSDPNELDFVVRDTKTQGNESHFWISKKFNKKIYIRENNSRAIPITAVTAKINLDPKLFDIDKINVSGVSDWTGVLQWHNTKDFPIPNSNKKFKLTYDENDTVGTNDLYGTFEGESSEFIIDYNRGNGVTNRIVIRYLHKFIRQAGITYVDENEYTVRGGSVRGEADRLKIEAVIAQKLVQDLNWNIEAITESGYGMVLSANIAVDGLPYTYSTRQDKRSGRRSEDIVDNKQGEGTLIVKVGVSIKGDFELIKQIGPSEQANPSTLQPQQNATQQAPEQPLEYTQINASELVKSEASLYSSQLEAILRIIQVTTISENIGSDGTLNAVKKIEWTDKKHQDRLYNGLFSQGALDGKILKEIVNEPNKEIITDKNKESYLKGQLSSVLTRHKMNIYYGFNRGLMKANDENIFTEKLDKPQYTVNFKELMTSYVIPYYQSKNLIDGGDVHYPTYVPLGFFFMMLNHCSFLYDTSIDGVNIPMFYLDFNPGSNVMLSSDFMLTANPYKFVVPFTGDLNSYKKLFDQDLIKGDKVGMKEDATPIWKSDAVSPYIPKFKDDVTDSSNIKTYRGKTMNVLVSIDYLLDVIKRHSKIDETNSVYFRPMMDELLSDLGKCLGNFNVFRLAYDDYSNGFYVVDDQSIPGQDVTYDDAKENTELPLFGKESIARSFTITTENSSKLGSMMFIGGNADVKNQTTLGIDATAIGNLSLYAVDRYKRVVTAPNDNESNVNQKKSQIEQKAIAASRFNQAIESYYYGGLRSENMVDQSVNYYIEAVAKARNTEQDVNLRATTLLPLSVNFSTDGISSMAIYQSFTVNDALLPYSYKYGLNQSETRKLGFIITGLEHTIQNNTWVTDVKANMYYVKRKGAYATTSGNQSAVERFKDLPAVLLSNDTTSPSGPISYRTNFVASREQRGLDARRIAETYYGKPFTDNDWNCLIAATYAESDYNDREKQSAWCAAVMINRARSSGDTVYAELIEKNQFQSVTGTASNGRKPSGNYVNGPSTDVEFVIYNGIIRYMKKSEIDYRYTLFTSNLDSAYGSGTNIGYKNTLKNSAGSTVVGNTIFAYG